MLGVVTRLAGGGSAGGTALGSVDGLGSAALFKFPFGISVSTSGFCVVADKDNSLIRTISPTGADLLKIILCAVFVVYAYNDGFRCGDKVGWWW